MAEITPTEEQREEARQIVDFVWPLKHGMIETPLRMSLKELIAEALATAHQRGRDEGLEEAAKVADAKKERSLAAYRRAEDAGREIVASYRQSDASTAHEIAGSIRSLKEEPR